MEITYYLRVCIQNKTPIAFVKYGDGEYLAAIGDNGCNCDKDTYTPILKDGLIESFRYMVDESPNAFIGIMLHDNFINFWKKLVKKNIRVAKYHTIIMDDLHPEKIQLLKAIKESKLKKIYVCNRLMGRAKILLNIDHMVHVPFNNWVDTEMERILNEVKEHMNEQCIVLTSAGMGAKILISKLSKLFPDNIYLDMGSALDKICTKKTSRGWEPKYCDFMDALKDIIPSNWESDEYNSIFEEAPSKIGLHHKSENSE